MIDKTLELKLHNQAINIKYFDFNRKLRNNIVFLHGLAATKDDFFWVCKYFENYRIIWFDYPTQINNLSIKDICDIFFELTKKFNNQTSIKSLAKDLVYKSKNNNLLKRFQKLPVKKNLYIQRTKLW